MTVSMKSGTYEYSLQKSKEYFNGDDLAAKVFVDKYCLQNDKNEYLENSPNDMHWRQAYEIARIESIKFKEPYSADFIFSLLKNFKYLVMQGSIMYGLGNSFKFSTLSNCYVIDSPEDSYGGILRADEEIAQISKRRGGVGTDISPIRPNKFPTRNSSKYSTGYLPYMDRYSNTINEVGQEGRRGALMLTSSIYHPQIMDFITAKNDNKKVTGANISVRLSDEFLKAVDEDADFELRWPVESENPLFKNKVKARELWNAIIHNAWLRAEPGILFWDRIINFNAIDCYADKGFKTTSTNPCCFAKSKSVLVITNNGIKEIKDIVKDDLVWVSDVNIWAKTSGYFDAGMAEIFRVKFSNKKELYITANHKLAKVYLKKCKKQFLQLENEREFLHCGFELVELKNLSIGDAVDLHNIEPRIWNPYLKPGEQYESDYRSGYLAKKEETHTFIVSIDSVGIEEVGCIEVENYHRFVANGIISGNSELPLCSYDSCRLMVQNLYGYVNKPFTKDAFFDFELFYKHAQILQRIMDDVIDLELEKIDLIIGKIKSDPESEEIKQRELKLWEKIRVKCIDGRRTGCGITALGDVFAALNIPYASEESIQLAEKIAKTQKLGVLRGSVDMAKEIGPFPVWDWNKEKDSEFLLPIQKEDHQLYEDMSKYGRRNIGHLTIAPTGSVSILTQTTSGIEPLFMMSYTRRKKINLSDENVKVDFVDELGQKWQHFEVYHPKIREWMQVTGETDLTKSPWYKCTADEIDWKNRVRLQAAMQCHLDHAISSTINLPEDVTEDKVAEIYTTAWKAGVKGITVYRKNCRAGVLIDKPEVKKESIIKNDAPKRPNELKADAYFVKTKGESYYVVIGLLNNEPYEVFTGKNLEWAPFTGDNREEVIRILPDDLGDNLFIKKIKRGLYELVDINNDKKYVLNNGHSDDNAEALTRMISTSLRHGADISFVVHQLEKTKGDMSAFAKVISRTLKKYIKDGTKVHGETCASCQSSSLERGDGCVICKNCGWTKCN